jgi:glutamyl-tRNA synthetase
LVRGKVKVNSREIDDQIILKADGFPTYHLAHAVDDHLMETTHVIRGEEWLPSTPKHILLFEALGWEPPVYAHLPMILNADKTKLSKRQGDVAVEDYLAKGYLPEALVNFIALLGWNPGTEKELFSLGELIKEFSLAKVHKAGAVFDIKKLDWMNGEYIKKMENKDFVQAAMPFFEKFLATNGLSLPGFLATSFDRAMALEQQRISRLDEVGEGIRFLLQNELQYDPASLVWKKSDAAKAKEILGLLASEISSYTEADFTKENLENKLKNFIAANNLTNGDVLWPLRVALTGAEKSPAPFEVAEILGKEATLNRLKQAVDKL